MKLTFEEIKEIKEESFLGNVYDLEVEIDNSYNIEGTIVHNSACTTRVKTGVGYPQLSLVLEIRDVLRENNLEEDILICSDGGCKIVGDIAKALRAGSDFVMIGGMLSGHTESPGNIEEYDGKKYKRFSGMRAKESQQEGVPNYGTDEGKTVMIPYKGDVVHTLRDIEGGIRSTCTYTNSHNLNELTDGHVNLIITSELENQKYNKR